MAMLDYQINHILSQDLYPQYIYIYITIIPIDPYKDFG